jgi:hypothetical protein
LLDAMELDGRLVLLELIDEVEADTGPVGELRLAKPEGAAFLANKNSDIHEILLEATF